MKNPMDRRAVFKIGSLPIASSLLATTGPHAQDLIEGPVTSGFYKASDFGCNADPSQDNTICLQRALDELGQLGGGILLLPHQYFVAGDLTVPVNVGLAGAHRAAGLKMHGTLWLGRHGSLDNMTVDFDQAGALNISESGRADHVRLRAVTLRNSSKHGLYAIGVSDLQVSDLHTHDNAMRGTHIIRCSQVMAQGVLANNNGHHGVGIFDTNVVHMDRITAHSNGSVVASGGISFASSSNIIMNSIIAYNNAEHGLGTTGANHFTINGLLSYGNARSGLNLQSGHAKDGFPPARNGVVSGFRIYDNYWGITLKEDCRDILFATGSCKDSTGKYNLRLVDIGQSGKKSSRIRAMGVDFIDEAGPRIVNSNRSDWVSINDDGSNYIRQATCTSKGATANITAAPTLDTTGRNGEYPEVFFVDGNGDRIQKTHRVEAIRGRKIILISNGESLTVDHNNFSVAEDAPFINKSREPYVLGVHQSVMYIADGKRWIQAS